MDSPVYRELDKAWRSTCRILFGAELGDLKEYDGWLAEYMMKGMKRNSHVSGKEVTFAMEDYCKDANFISLDECTQKPIDPLSINEIKDIDSIVGAVSEKWEYTGNKVLGNSAFVEGSDNVTDSQYVMNSLDVYESQYIYASSMSRISKYTFGSASYGKGEFLIRFFGGYNIRRCFDSGMTNDSSDIYFSNNIAGCSDMMFCFHQRSKRNCIGNLQLTKEKYAELKRKLLDEVADELRRTKTFPSLFELLLKEPSNDADVSIPSEKAGDMSQIDKAFASAYRIILKRAPGNILEYGGWLSRHVSEIKELTTPFGNKTYLTTDPHYSYYAPMLKRMVSLKEGFEIENWHLDENEITSVGKIKDNIGKIGYPTMELYEGTNMNIMKTPVSLNSMNIYRTWVANESESCAYSFWIPLSKYQFGCYIGFESEFCINCHNSFNLKRCLELDACKNCSDSYFLHNCEGLSEAMFCFNAKSKRYAIGNAELPQDLYRKVRDMLVQQMADELDKKKELKWDIYNVGCSKK